MPSGGAGGGRTASGDALATPLPMQATTFSFMTEKRACDVQVVFSVDEEYLYVGVGDDDDWGAEFEEDDDGAGASDDERLHNTHLHFCIFT